MNGPQLSENSQGWMAFVWISFGLAVSANIIGIYNLPVEFWVKGYMAMGSIFCMGTCFTLSKTVRDNHEAKKLINRVSEAKTERMLQEFEFKG